MIKYCPNCKMNFSESFEECPCCEGELIIRDLSAAETIELDILEMTDEELLSKYQEYLQSIRQQGYQITDKEFVDGLREGRKDIYRNTNINILEESELSTITCPYCKSTNCRKISFLSRFSLVSIGGSLGTVANGKQWHCNNCDSDF